MLRLLTLLVAALPFVAAKQNTKWFTLQGAAVTVVFPSGFKDQRMDMALADFGEPQYGGSMIAKLVYPTEDPSYNPDGIRRRCSGDSECQYACDSFELAKPAFDFKKQPGEFIVMLLDRGPRSLVDTPCYFIKKVYNAQMAGADAVLVVDDSDDELTTAVPPEEEALAHYLVDIRISASLISRKDGQFLKSKLKDQQQVTVALNWTNLEPRRDKVEWEYWTTSSDQCGTLCKQQQQFVRDMKPLARALDQANLTTFSAHYMLWSCPSQYSNTEECSNECIANGLYCAPDPDGDYVKGYKGSDVLFMNIRHMCFARLAQESGSPWLWWDFAEGFSLNCTSAANNFNQDCAAKVFTLVGGPYLANNNGTNRWQECIAQATPLVVPAVNTTGANTTTNSTDALKIPMLEEEMNLQQGDNETATVSILPTIRVNGRQYRGTLDKAGVLRALCAAFPMDKEPSVCNEKWVAPDECEPASKGAKNCRSQDPSAGGRNRCVNTFSGYKCECGQGFIRGVKDTGEETCEDLNECLATNVLLTDPACGCDRCACINLVGSYRCTGPLPDRCTAAENYGGCWSGKVDGVTQHACVETLTDYQRDAMRGKDTGKWHTCKCPGCFAAQGGTVDNPSCVAMCPLNQCFSGQCLKPIIPSGGKGGDSGSGGGTQSGGGGGPGTKSGMSAGGVFLVVLITIGMTFGGLYAVYQYYLKDRMHGDIRDIMAQYMPLGNDRPRRRGPPGGASRHYSADDDEDEEDAEDAPLVARSAQEPGSRGYGSGGMGRAMPLGSLTAPQQQSAPSPAVRTTGGYQPPVVPLVPDDEDDSRAGMTPGFGSAPKAQASTSESEKQPPSKALVNDMPLLGEGPL